MHNNFFKWRLSDVYRHRLLALYYRIQVQLHQYWIINMFLMLRAYSLSDFGPMDNSFEIFILRNNWVIKEVGGWLINVMVIFVNDKVVTICQEERKWVIRIIVIKHFTKVKEIIIDHFIVIIYCIWCNHFSCKCFTDYFKVMSFVPHRWSVKSPLRLWYT